MKLWSGTLSPFSTKVRIALAEKGLTCEIAEIPWTKATLWGPKPQAFLDVSPKGEVPVLEDAGLAIVDSTVINEYLEDAYPAVPLMPADPTERAVCRMFEDMADDGMAKHLTVLIREVYLKPDGAGRDNEALEAAKTFYAGYLNALERRLAGRAYLCSAFSLADIATAIGLSFAQTLSVTLADHAQVQRWHQQICARPTVAAEISKIMAAAAAA